MADEVKKVKRTEFATFMNVGTKAEPVWARIGKGVTGQSVAYNPNVSEEQYINEDSGTSSVESYKPNIPTPQTAYVGDKVFDFVDAIRKKRAVGAEAETEILLVYIYNKTGDGAEATYEAEKNNCAIQIDDFGGDAGNPVVLNYTINLNGDPTIGTVKMADNQLTFTEKTDNT